MAEGESKQAMETLKERNFMRIMAGFARFGVDPQALADELAARMSVLPPDSPESLMSWNALYLERLPPFSALFVGAETPFGQWDVIDFLAACYPTVGQMFHRIARHFVLINPHFEFVIDDGAAGELPFVEFRHRLLERDDFFDEYNIGIFLGHLRNMTRTDLRLTAARFVQARPTDPSLRAAIESYLGCVPTYGARYARMVYSRESWTTPLSGANARLRDALEAHAEALGRELEAARSFGQRVRLAIAQSLRDGDPRLAEVAQRLGMSARTMQRRLRDEDLGFTEMVEEARMHMARRYLVDDTLSISEMSFALGFSEPSAFTRAFRRWAGSAPAEYREAARRAQ